MTSLSDQDILDELGVDKLAESLGERRMGRYRAGYAKRLFPASFHKVCTKCSMTKTLDQFYTNGKPPSSGDGRRPDCKRCHSAQEATRHNYPENVVDDVRGPGPGCHANRV